MTTPHANNKYNITLATLLAILSYVPFVYVAQGTLIASVVLFILDPIPPVTRVLALLSILFVRWISQWHRQYQNNDDDHHQPADDDDDDVVIQQQQHATANHDDDDDDDDDNDEHEKTALDAIENKKEQ